MLLETAFAMILFPIVFVICVYTYPVTWPETFNEFLHESGIIIMYISTSFMVPYLFCEIIVSLNNVIDNWYYTEERIKKRVLKTLTIPIEGDKNLKFFTRTGLHVLTGYKNLVFTRHSVKLCCHQEQLNTQILYKKDLGKIYEPKGKVVTFWQSNDNEDIYTINLNNLYLENHQSPY